MDKLKSKPRITILTRIGVLFLATLIVTAVVIVNISRDFMLERAADQAESLARLAGAAVTSLIESEDTVNALKDDQNLKDDIHETFRYICAVSGLKYLYLYIAEDNPPSREYLECAAFNDEEDALIREFAGYGKTQVKHLYDAEKTVLSGNVDGAYEFVNNEYGVVCMYILPLLDSNGKVIALVGADYSMDSIRNLAHKNLRFLLAFGALLLGATCIIAMLLIKGLVIRPIHVLSGRMKNFVNDENDQNLTEKRKTHFKDEVTDIEDSFEDMAVDIRRYIGDIETLTADKIQTQTQLDIARKIQEGIVPGEMTLAGDGYDIYGCMYPAKEVGGDFYDMFKTEDDRICIVVGDISGKGITAALFMTMVKTIIRENLKAGIPVAQTLNRTNDELCASNPQCMFATVFAAIFDPSTGVMEYANAGHNKPVYISAKNEKSNNADKSGNTDTGKTDNADKSEPATRFITMDSGIVLGLFEDSDIIQDEIVLGDGDGLFIYTDGITETINSSKEQFGEERLAKTLADMSDGNGSVGNGSDGDGSVGNGPDGSGGKISARALTLAVADCVADFSKDMEQFDDITGVAVVYHKSMDTREKTDTHMEPDTHIESENCEKPDAALSIPPERASFEKIKETILASLRNGTDSSENKKIIQDCPDLPKSSTSDSDTKKIILACEEIFANIVDYSNADDVTFSCNRSSDELAVTFTDNGIPFDPVTAEIREKDFEDLDSGGMGIKLARMNSKQMIYKRDGNRNVLTIIFEVPEKPKKNVRL